MMKPLKSIFTVLGIAALSIPAIAGNPDRAGEAGAYELLINGWARSSGMFSMNSACVKGLEATSINPGGLAFVRKTEVLASYTNWFTGSGVHVINAGLAQKLGKANVIGVSVASFNFGEIQRTTTTNPEGGLGTFKPSFLNIGLSYARNFSKSIHGGITARMVNERTADVSAMGVAFDAGIEYSTGKRDQIHFGVAIRNVGTPMRFTGDGFTFRGVAPQGTYNMTQVNRSEKFSLPSQLNIGAAYDLYLGKTKAPAPSDGGEAKKDEKEEPEVLKPANRITIAANFTSNSVGKDQLGAGLEYAYKESFMIRCGYRWEKGILSKDETKNTTLFTGLAAGVTFETPLKKGKPQRLGFDYSFRMTNKFDGVHSGGIRILL